jgi:UDP-N-acetylglucosamine--N-acetylmuramyl-(pentapeptide) pyrophosphoryl-undecaprenol N-acetylglucosamine transferase
MLPHYKLFKNHKAVFLNSRPLRTKNIFKLISNLFFNLMSFLFILSSFIQRRPAFIFGAGGYVCGPTLLAGFILRIPVYIIEQNAVLGLTNKILGWIATKIFVHFSQTQGLSPRLKNKVLVVGNPTRKQIHPVAIKPFQAPLKVLVFGGSLGAQQINQLVWSFLDSSSMNEVSIHHQLGVGVTPPQLTHTDSYLPMTYIEDMQKEYEWCDVIIARSGASTISELALIKKPSLLLPYPAATDNHQWYNAKIFQQESDFTVEIINPKASVAETQEQFNSFLSKAIQQQLTYTKIMSPGNHSCENILKEILNYVGPT